MVTETMTPKLKTIYSTISLIYYILCFYENGEWSVVRDEMGWKGSKGQMAASLYAITTPDSTRHKYRYYWTWTLDIESTLWWTNGGEGEKGIPENVSFQGMQCNAELSPEEEIVQIKIIHRQT